MSVFDPNNPPVPASTPAPAPTPDAPSTDTSNLEPFYCPGCGKQVGYLQQCTGKPESPHPPIEVVSTDELTGDPSGHTPAPPTTNLG